MFDKFRTLIAVSATHAIQDGLVSIQFVLLPLLASTLGLNYAQVGLLKAIASSAVAILEIPSALLADKHGERILLCLGLAAAAMGYTAVAMSNTFFWVAAGFLFAGSGAGFQHSLSSSLLARRYTGAERRRTLGIYNSAGDTGKLLFTALFGILIGFGLAWSTVVLLLAVCALLFSGVVYWLLVPSSPPRPQHQISGQSNERGWGIQHRFQFALIAAVTFLDGVVQAVFLTFIAFILLQKGATAGQAAFAVVLTLAGGLVGKFASGFLAAHVGDRTAFQLLQLLTVAGLLIVIFLPAAVILFLLPLVGLAVQGSSTVYYGSVAECAHDGHQSKIYGLIYTLANGASVVGPVALGYLANRYGLDLLLWLLIALTLSTMVMGLGFTSRVRHTNT